MTQPNGLTKWEGGGAEWNDALQAYVGYGDRAGWFYYDGGWQRVPPGGGTRPSITGNDSPTIHYWTGTPDDGRPYGTYITDHVTGLPVGDPIGNPQAPRVTSSVTVHNTPIQNQGGRYETVQDVDGTLMGIPGAWVQIDHYDDSKQIVSKPATPAANFNPADRNNDGLDDTTNMALGVYRDATSPSGFYYASDAGERIPVLPNGARFNAPIDTRIPEPPAGPTVGGVPYVWDTKAGKYVPAPGISAVPSQGSTRSSSGGGSDPLSSMITAQINANSRAASDAAAAARQAASAQAAAAEDAARYGFQSAEAEKSRQFAREQQERADALRVALERPGYELARSKFQLEQQEGKLRAADSVAAHISDTDPGAYAAFLAAGGGNIANAIAAGGNAVSDKAKLGAARALAASEQPIDLPPTWDELFPASGSLRLGGSGGVSLGGTSGVPGGNTSPTGATGVATRVPNPLDPEEAQPALRNPGWSPVPAMQSNFDFTAYGGPKVDLGDMVRATMTRLLGPGGGFVHDSAPPTISTGGAGGIGPGFPIQDAAPPVPLAVAPTVPAPAGDRPVPLANPFAAIPEATRAALLATGGLAPAVQQQLLALAPRKALGGFTTDPIMMVGDAEMGKRPDAGGARPEMIELMLTPDGRPAARVHSTEETLAMLHERPLLGKVPRYGMGTATWQIVNAVTRASQPAAPVYTPPPPVYTPPPPVYTPPPPPIAPVTAIVTPAAPAPRPLTGAVSSPPSATTVASQPAPTVIPKPPASVTPPPPPPTFQNTSPVPLSTPASTPAPAPAPVPPVVAPPLVATAPQPAPAPATVSTAATPIPATAPVLGTPTAATGGLQIPAAAALPTTNAQALSNFVAAQATANTGATAPQDIITEADRAYLDRIGAIRAGALYPELNPYATDFWSQDPTVREMFLKGRQTKLGIPYASSVWDAQRFAIPGISRGSLRIGR